MEFLSVFASLKLELSAVQMDHTTFYIFKTLVDKSNCWYKGQKNVSLTFSTFAIVRTQNGSLSQTCLYDCSVFLVFRHRREPDAVMGFVPKLQSVVPQGAFTDDRSYNVKTWYKIRKVCYKVPQLLLRHLFYEESNKKSNEF